MARSIRDQELDELGGAGSVLARQRRDHERLDELIERFHASDGGDRWVAFSQIVRLASSHAFAEEAVLWPAVRERVVEGEALTRRVEEEHQEINELVAAIDRAADDEAGRAELAAQVIGLLVKDARDEEDVLLPRLQEQLKPSQLRRLGRRWEVVRRIAPTRAHPLVSRRPPGNIFAALPLTVLDRCRDGLEYTTARSDRARRTLASADRWLAAGAGAVERLQPLQRGERSTTRAGRTRVER